MTEIHARRSRKRRRARSIDGGSQVLRSDSYRQLRHPFTPQSVFSDDAVHRIHGTALRVLQELGIKILLPEARGIFRDAGALVDDDSMMVRIGADLVAHAIRTAPVSIRLRSRSPLQGTIV